jgi:CrcB protein
MLVRGQHVMAAAYSVSSIVGSVLLLVCGIYLARVIG